MPFPAAKLFSVALRQLSKPMAAYLQNSAQGNLYFKNACVYMATHYHTLEQRIINRFYDKDEKNQFIPRLNEEKAVKLGATIIGEAFIFAVAGNKDLNIILISVFQLLLLIFKTKQNKRWSRGMLLQFFCFSFVNGAVCSIFYTCLSVNKY